MLVSAIELRVVEFELVVPVGTATTRHGVRPVVLVRVLPADGPEGWGECAALAEPTYTAEYAEGAAAILAHFLVPSLLERPVLSEEDPAGEVLSRLARYRGNPMAKAAIEMAVLDAFLRAAGRSLATHLGATRRRVPAGATLSVGDPVAVVAAAQEAEAAGYRRVKCKIAPGRDVDSVRAVREACPRLSVSVDANGSYCLDDPDHLRRLKLLDELGLATIEQPLAPRALSAHAALARQLETPVVLDESVEDAADLEAAISLGALDGLSVKPGRLGGIGAAVAAHDGALAAGIHLVVGGMFETGLARAAHLAVAALPGFDLPGDLGASDRYFAPDLTVRHVLVDGELEVPDSPGVGRAPDPAVLAAVTRKIAFGTSGAGAGNALSWNAAR